MARAQDVINREWGHDLIGSWNTAGWFDLPKRLGDQLAPLIGARGGEVVVTDSTSLNLFKALAGALRMQADASPAAVRRVIVSERANFPTDLYIAESLAGWLAHGYSVRLVDSSAALPAAIDADCAVLMLTHVNYRTGYQHDLHADGADLAVGCTYKYLNGGPGAPAFIWVPYHHQAAFHQPLAGWWGHCAPFAMASRFAPADGIGRALCGTQPIVSLALVECGLDVFDATDMAAIRAKSLALTDLFIALVEARCGAHPLKLATPRARAARQPRQLYPSARLRGDGRAAQARRHRRLPRAGHRALRLDAAVQPFR